MPTPAGLEVGDPMRHKQGIWQIALSHDGRRLASVDNATIRVWDQNTRRHLGDSLPVQEKYWFSSITWSPDGQSVITGHDEGKISSWDVAPLAIESSDTTTVLVTSAPINVVAGNPPQPSSSRPRTGSLSSSFLDLPATALPPNNPKPNPPPLPDDFWDSSDLDPPSLVRPPILSVSRDERPAAKQPISASSKTTAKTAVSTSPAKPVINLFARIFAHFRRDKRAANNIEMQPPRASHPPKHSPVVKVPLAEADARLYTPGQKKEPEPVDDGDVSEESIRDDGCLNAICFCEFFKWLKYRRELRREECQRQERRERRRQERAAQAAQEHQSQPSLIAEGENQAGSAST
ncbi:hypothetical protein BJ138DRAFT_1129646 [Hygrophoropsis aurantiaca]|uniref:Uncharacterized protein n=1 Tax=Hygrophoropsis aurantiaca TaxID=72124 RepID=A0ACB8A0U1_9AGAM|nr:hypothetical protein BJ138DRAFT_1129646 [Hygrophoropsis aurantiaca]